MEIIKTNIENLEQDKRNLYMLTRAASIGAKDAADQIINVSAYLLYKDTDRDGAEREVLAIVSDAGQKIATISPTFKAEFMFIADMMSGEDFAIRIIKGKSKNGRDFVTCELA